MLLLPSRLFIFWDRALPAADFDVTLVLLSFKTLDAAEAADLDVTFFGALVWDKALPAAFLDDFPVDLLLKVLDAAAAAFFPVTFLLVMPLSPSHFYGYSRNILNFRN